MKEYVGAKVIIDMNTTVYNITLALDHILIDTVDGILLVDTGSPMSFHENGLIRLGGEEFPVPTSLMGVDSSYIAEKVGVHVSGLLGMDIISRTGMKIDIPGRQITLSPSTDGMNRVPSRTGMGYMSIEMFVAGKPANVILDTGAPTSYVARMYTEGLTPIGQVTDFNPLVPGDTFETPVFEFPASFAGNEFTMKAGHLPGSLQMMLSVLGVDGVVGMELLKRFPVAIADGSVWV